MKTEKIIDSHKIYDGMFMGNQIAATDLDWLTTNKVTHIVNCAFQDIPHKHYQKQAITYLNFDWTQQQIQTNLFGYQNCNLDTFEQFLEKAKTHGGSVLVHGKNSDSRGCCLIIAFLMKRYSWNIFKALEFMNSRNNDAQIQSQFFQQLNTLHKRLSEAGLIKTAGWQLLPEDHEQLVITNTFLNSQQKYQKVETSKIKTSRTGKRVEWKDNKDKSKLEDNYKFSDNHKVCASDHQAKTMGLKSILKGFKNHEQKTQNKVSFEKQRPKSITKQVSAKKEKRAQKSSSCPKSQRKTGQQSDKHTKLISNKQKIKDFCGKSKIRRAQLKNTSLFKEQIRQKEEDCYGCALTDKTNLDPSIYYPSINNCCFSRKPEQWLDSSKPNGYLKLLRMKMNQTIQPELISQKKESEIIPKKERCSSAKRKMDMSSKENDIFNTNTLSHNQLLFKPKWK